MTEPDNAESVITPASTGAQHDEAMPENTPSAKKLPVSPRLVSGARTNDGRRSIRPDRLNAASTSMRRPPA